VQELPRFWIAMLIVLVVCVMISAVIAVIRLA
jgi:ABC-type multidrug transport system permease subunit